VGKKWAKGAPLGEIASGCAVIRRVLQLALKVSFWRERASATQEPLIIESRRTESRRTESRRTGRSLLARSAASCDDVAAVSEIVETVRNRLLAFVLQIEAEAPGPERGHQEKRTCLSRGRDSSGGDRAEPTNGEKSHV
jgi:hypothetical protein